MIETSAKYKAAVTGDARRTLLRAYIEIIDPDITYGEASSSGAAEWSKPEQLQDKTASLDSPFATLERNRWLLNGSTLMLECIT